MSDKTVTDVSDRITLENARNIAELHNDVVGEYRPMQKITDNPKLLKQLNDWNEKHPLGTPADLAKEHPALAHILQDAVAKVKHTKEDEAKIEGKILKNADTTIGKAVTDHILTVEQASAVRRNIEGVIEQDKTGFVMGDGGTMTIGKNVEKDFGKMFDESQRDLEHKKAIFHEALEKGEHEISNASLPHKHQQHTNKR